MKRPILIILLFSVLSLCGCNIEENFYENAIGSNAITSEIEYSDEEKTAIEVGEYFLENYNNQNFSKEDTYYIDANDKTYHMIPLSSKNVQKMSSIGLRFMMSIRYSYTKVHFFIRQGVI